jgi:TatD DNase family protein
VIDFHCHLDLYPRPNEVASAADRAGIYVLSVTTTPKAWKQTAALASGKKHIRTALGIHPQLAHERSAEIALFEHLLDETRYVGEIGLDGSRGFGQHAEIHMRVFERILSVARERGGKIFTVHSRGAADIVVATLLKHRCASTAVLHWFSGTLKQLDSAVSAGCWFSIGPAMLRSEKGRQLISRMPRDRILTETDGPFAQDKNKPLEPGDVALAIDGLASLWSTDRNEVDQLLRTNLKALLL